MYAKLTQPGVGFDYERREGRVVVRGASFAAGSVLALDMVQDYATSADVGSATSMLSIARLVYAASLLVGPLVVLQEAVADRHSGMAVMVGRTRAWVLPSGLSVSVGSPLFAVNGQRYLTDAPGNGQRAVGRAMENSSGASQQLLDVEFDGDNGLYSYLTP